MLPIIETLKRSTRHRVSTHAALHLRPSDFAEFSQTTPQSTSHETKVSTDLKRVQYKDRFDQAGLPELGGYD